MPWNGLFPCSVPKHQTVVETILQIEDDEGILEISRIAIELTPSIELHQAATGQAGLDMLVRVKPDVVLLDVMMPDMDGPETLRRIRDSGYASVPVILLTARARRDDIEALERLGVAGVIVKPFDPLTLVKQIEDTLTRSGSTLD